MLMPPFFIMLFSSFDALPIVVRLGLLIDPFTHLLLAIQNALIGSLAESLASIGAMLGFTIALLRLSSWLFMEERLITVGARIRRRKAIEE